MSDEVDIYLQSILENKTWTFILMFCSRSLCVACEWLCAADKDNLYAYEQN